MGTCPSTVLLKEFRELGGIDTLPPMNTLRLLILCMAITAGALAQARQGGGARGNAAAIDWNKPFPAHTIIGNVHVVGSEQLGSFLITTSEGHILINSDYEETVPILRSAHSLPGWKS